MPGALHPGSLIAHYRVISAIGAGGMGEVYMAQDEKLERAVALKVLPPELVKNEERRRRFVQEAKSASSLSHPHIITIYEIGEAPVRSGEEGEEAPEGPPIHYIAMELISGETLKQKIHGEQEDLRSLLRYLAQAAEGLAKAHGAGIVHRDLKPENIMISKDGYAKVLDFGLAKLTERKSSSDDATSLPTTTREGTRDGAVMGTVGYMSPEQVRGKRVDHRTDIFSFGCMLYESATRTRPFTADSEVETMHKILHNKPEPVEEINAQVPNALRRMIRRCLDKSPDRRFHSMKDLSLEIHDIVEEYEELATTAESRGSASSTSAPALAGPGGMSKGIWLGIGLAAVVAVAGIAFGIYGLTQRGTGEPPAQTSFDSMKMTRLTSTGTVRGATISPDGRYLIHSIRDTSGHALWIKQVATGSDVQIVKPLPTAFVGQSFSPDGNYVYYVNRETGGPGYSILFQVPVLGGEVRKLLFDIDSAVSFSPDGKQFVFQRGYPQQNETALMVANVDGTGERKLAVRKAPKTFPNIPSAWSPQGTHIAAVGRSLEGGTHAEVVLVDPNDGSEKLLGDQSWIFINSLAWLPDGSGLVLTAAIDRTNLDGQIWSISYPEGKVSRITNDLNNYRDVSITADGKSLSAIQRDRVSNVWVVPAENPGAARQVTFGSGQGDDVNDVRAAPDGTILFSAAQGDDFHVWKISADGRDRTRVTPGTGIFFNPDISRDGRVIAFASLGKDSMPHIWAMDADGGNLRQVTSGEKGEDAPWLSPDGRWLLFSTRTEKTLHKIDLQSGTITLVAEDRQNFGIFSPDGKRIAYERYLEEGGRLNRTASVMPADGGEPTINIPWTQGFGMRWHPSGEALTVNRTVDGVGQIWKVPLDGGNPEQITDFKTGLIFSYDWSTDGQQIFLGRGNTSSDVVLINNFR